MIELKLNDGTLVIAEIHPCMDDDGSIFPTLANLCAFDGELTKEQYVEAEEKAWFLIDKMK